MRNTFPALLITFAICLFAPAFPACAQLYQQELDAWYQKRAQSLTAENGWLNLAGLYWLQPGKNSFGSGSDVKLQFPTGSIVEQAGYFEWLGDSVVQYSTIPAGILVNGQATDRAVVYNKGKMPAPVSAAGNLRWTVIRRSEKIGVRLRNVKSEAVTGFKGIYHFAADRKWVVTARLVTSPVPKYLSITNVLGQVNQEKSPGTLHFSLEGKEYSLDALEENNQLFIIFSDATSGESTYSSGRFLLAALPGADGITVLDFNKAYNPPCAFSTYATCPLPPKQNILPLAINAGEKTYNHP